MIPTDKERAEEAARGLSAEDAAFLRAWSNPQPENHTGLAAKLDGYPTSRSAEKAAMDRAVKAKTMRRKAMSYAGEKFTSYGVTPFGLLVAQALKDQEHD